MEVWSDNKKFWHETLRTIIFTTLGVVGVYFIVDPLKNKSSYEAELSRERLSLKSALIDNFLSKSHKYCAISFDALNGDLHAINL